MIEIRNLTARVRKAELLHDISCTIDDGQLVALLGPNGAGKTTLLKHLNGLMKPSSGSVLINGMDTRKTKTSVLAREVGFLFQNPDRQILCSTVYDELCFGLKHCDVAKTEWEERIQHAAADCSLSALLQEDPILLPRSLRQRVALASVLAVQTGILVLDEPTSAQDEKETQRLMKLVMQLVEKGRTVVLVSHDMELVARYADRVLVLIEGTLHADCPVGQFFNNTSLLEQASLKVPGLYRLASKLNLEPFSGKGFNASALADMIAGIPL